MLIDILVYSSVVTVAFGAAQIFRLAVSAVKT
jgi:hypothetical protein